MSRILAVHASPRGERSQSRRLAEVFLEAYREAHPQARVARREVGRVPLPAVTEAFVAAAFHPQPEQRSLAMQADLALSDQLVGELFDSDLLVISTPMYNFSVPSGLKAWVDQIVRLGVTFDFVLDNGVAQYRPLLRGKRALIVTSRGGHGFGPGGENQAMNHADPGCAPRWVSSASTRSRWSRRKARNPGAGPSWTPAPRRNSACWRWRGRSEEPPWPGSICWWRRPSRSPSPWA